MTQNRTFEFTVELLSDACPGSGLGGEIANGLISRRADGRPIIGDSHLKGLVRQFLADLFKTLGKAQGWNDAWPARILGSPGYRSGKLPSEAACDSAFVINDAVADDIATRIRQRTAIDAETGVAREKTLRAYEILPAGLVFRGSVNHWLVPGGPEEDLLRLSLLSINTVGSHRTRGVGRCRLRIDGESRSPGSILEALAGRLATAPAPAPPLPAGTAAVAGPIVWLDVIFEAEKRILVPEFPETLNVIRSGFSISASAVQGALLTELSRHDSAIAGLIFACDTFRFWPLQPVAEKPAAQLPRSVRVSITHRVAKLLDDPSLAPLMLDEAIEPYDYANRPRNTPIKAPDGVLLWTSAGDKPAIRLWKAGEMERIFVTRGVHGDPQAIETGGRNVYSIEAMAPIVWRGCLAGPESLVRQIEELDGARIRVGKERATCGTGIVRFNRFDPSELFAPASSRRVLIAQSPLLLPDETPKNHSSALLRTLADQWTAGNALGAVDEVWAFAGLQFGWNRHNGNNAAGHGRTRARRIIYPGAVIRLKEPADPIALREALLRGVGEGRSLGFGSLLPHPGIASDVRRREPSHMRMTSAPRTREVVETAQKIRDQARGHLSPSQIKELLERRTIERMKAFLDERDKRPALIANAWRNSKSLFYQLLDRDADFINETLRLIRDMLPPKEQIS